MKSERVENDVPRDGAMSRREPNDERRDPVIHVSLSDELVSRLERYERHLRALEPNLKITRAGLVRALLERGLVDFELEGSPD